MKLTNKQQQAISKMKSGLWYSSYDLGVSISTMEALTRKGVVRKRGVGSLEANYSPRIGIEFQLIEKRKQ